MKYRKKPVVIEAFRLGHDAMPDWAKGDERLHCAVVGNDGAISHVCIDTLEGTMRAECGDYIIKGIKGELYSCKSDIFHETYERADEDVERATRCNEYIWSQKINGFYVCCNEGVAQYFVDGNHFCLSGKPRGEQ